MKVTVKKTYTFDGLEFDSKEQVQQYKKLYIPDDKLIELFKLFHEIPQDRGNYETAQVPGDASKYEIIIERTQDGGHFLDIKQWYKTVRDNRYGVETFEFIKESLRILPNRDFRVGFEGTKEGELRTYSFQYFLTPNAVDFYNKMKELDLYTGLD